MRTDDLRAHITLGPSILMLLACKPIPNLVEVGNERARSVFTIPPASPSLPRLFNILLQAAIGDAAAIDASFPLRSTLGSTRKITEGRHTNNVS